MLSNIGLYYPFINFPDDSWVKLAALYWDKLGRIVLPEYTLNDSETVQQLAGELGFIVNFRPSQREVDDIGATFLTLLKQHQHGFERYYNVSPYTKSDYPPQSSLQQSWPSPSEIAKEWLPPSQSPQQVEKVTPPVAYIFAPGRINDETRAAFIDAGIARPSEKNPALLGIHPKLATVYLEALAHRMSVARKFNTVTDEILHHLAIGGYAPEKIAQALLLSDSVRGDVPLTDAKLTEEEIEAQMALLALQTVLPKGLENQSVKKIIHFRKKHGNELAVFQSYLQETVQKMSEVRDIEDPMALQSHLEAVYEKTLKPQLEDLQACLKSFGIETVLGAMNVRIQLPALFAGAGVTYFDPAHLGPIVPIIVGTGVAALSLFPVVRENTKKARDKISASPAGYLLNVREELQPIKLNSMIARRAQRLFFHKGD